MEASCDGGQDPEGAVAPEVDGLILVCLWDYVFSLTIITSVRYCVQVTHILLSKGEYIGILRQLF
jgi:hypothetical protein